MERRARHQGKTRIPRVQVGEVPDGVVALLGIAILVLSSVIT
jgi:hypothetical protein